MLVVLRGPSGSGKSTVARLVQERLGSPAAILGLDHFRRVVYRERLDAGMEHASLLASAAEHCLARGHHVILDGIFDGRRYSTTLEGIAALSDDSRFYAFDLTFEETLARHATRPQAREFGESEMRSWYLAWQPLTFVDERRIGPEESLDDIADRILTSR